MRNKMEKSAENLDMDNAGEDRVFQLMNKVFSVDLLLDKILDHLILDHDEGKKTVGKVQDCRLVSKAWLQSINRIFRKSEKPLFVFNPAAKANQFIKSVKRNLQMDKHVPPYSIVGSATPIFFDCLSHCGSGLIQLDLDISGKLSSHVSLTKKFFLPRVCKLTILMWSSNDPNDESSVMEMIKFIQTIFDASKQLKSFTLFNRPSIHSVAPADCFENLLFPSSITHLDFRSPNDSQLEALLNSSLPNLKTLEFSVNNTPIKNGLITRVLLKVNKTLQTLHVYTGTGGFYSRLKRTTGFQLPVMEKLKQLSINTRYFELEAGHCSSSLQQQLAPILEKVTLYNQTKSMLRKWTDHLCFPNVTFLTVSLVRGGIGEGLRSSANFDFVTMQALHLAFPMVKELIISRVSSTDMTALLFIMREMTSLHCLRITVVNEEELQSSDIWDAILTGIPQESVGALRESPNLWESLQVGNDVSIRNLTELRTLKLIGTLSECPFITKVAFQYAFMKMPKLTHLILSGGFQVTMEMAEMWKMEGRTIDALIFPEGDEQVSESESSDDSDSD